MTRQSSMFVKPVVTLAGLIVILGSTESTIAQIDERVLREVYEPPIMYLETYDKELAKRLLLEGSLEESDYASLHSLNQYPSVSSSIKSNLHARFNPTSRFNPTLKRQFQDFRVPVRTADHHSLIGALYYLTHRQRDHFREWLKKSPGTARVDIKRNDFAVSKKISVIQNDIRGFLQGCITSGKSYDDCVNMPNMKSLQHEQRTLMKKRTVLETHDLDRPYSTLVPTFRLQPNAVFQMNMCLEQFEPWRGVKQAILTDLDVRFPLELLGVGGSENPISGMFLPLTLLAATQTRGIPLPHKKSDTENQDRGLAAFALVAHALPRWVLMMYEGRYGSGDKLPDTRFAASAIGEWLKADYGPNSKRLPQYTDQKDPFFPFPYSLGSPAKGSALPQALSLAWHTNKTRLRSPQFSGRSDVLVVGRLSGPEPITDIRISFSHGRRGIVQKSLSNNFVVLPDGEFFVYIPCKPKEDMMYTTVSFSKYWPLFSFELNLRDFNSFECGLDPRMWQSSRCIDIVLPYSDSFVRLRTVGEVLADTFSVHARGLREEIRGLIENIRTRNFSGPHNIGNEFSYDINRNRVNIEGDMWREQLSFKRQVLGDVSTFQN